MGVTERRARQKALLRQEILDAARDILVREGYAGLSMRKVADKIDYSPTAIYLHFKDRDDLVFSVCEQVMTGLVRELQEVVRQNPDPLISLRKGLRRYIDFGLSHPQHYLVTFVIPHAAAPEGEAFEKKRTMGLEAFSFLPRIVGECVRQKKLNKVDVEMVSRAIWTGLHGVTSLLITMPNFEWGAKDKLVDQVIDLLLDGLVRKKA